MSFCAKTANFYIFKLVLPKSRLAMSHPLNHRLVNLRIDSCLDVSDWDSCPQQTYLILLHGHLAAYTHGHMLWWHSACLLVGQTLSLGLRRQDNRLSWAPSVTVCILSRLKKSFLGNKMPCCTTCLFCIHLPWYLDVPNTPKRKEEKTDWGEIFGFQRSIVIVAMTHKLIQFTRDLEVHAGWIVYKPWGNPH